MPPGKGTVVMELASGTGRPVLTSVVIDTDSRPATDSLSAEVCDTTAQRSPLSEDSPALPVNLRAALAEWAEVADRVVGTEAARGTLGWAVSDRGRRLGRWLASATSSDVVYLDPIREVQVRISSADNRPERSPAGEAADSGTTESTPWVTGLTVSAVIAVIVTITLTTVSLGWAESTALFAAGINVAVVGGLVPAMWLLRRTPIWRWIVYGAAAGVVLAWTGLLIAALAAVN
ncbi:DUF2537 domain-containing protein [Actinoalloteichus hymeniacidonis]|uniref:DUF2537 family protein n=1 Tax=Actinoalloteichus hymeniacidonis TaxID=340345 RepID=A0AAC9HUU3_9PSEU|nr:DUF2537 domain-containing protein [Actinoalloteichus hymeniacidonis]AOS65813.1 putative DUF2537 family protein [Actinoalloteichus hymeniacidonis]MBB5906096.1 hypothetical protein [Actinoalloteichus hymeniacidonis]